VLEVGGKPVSGFQGMATLIREHAPGETVALLIERDGRQIEVPVTVGEAEENGERVSQIGVWRITEPPAEWAEMAERLRSEQRYGVIASVGHGVAKTWDMSALTVSMLGHMVVGEVSMRNISGPIAIADYAGDSAQAGLSAFLSFLAIVSISLGILNLLPVPILDGGQIVYQVAEWIKGSPLSERVMLFGQQLGILFMILLMGFVFYNDLTRVFS